MNKILNLILVLAMVSVLYGCKKDKKLASETEVPEEEVVDNTIEPLTKKIMDNTTVIGTFVSDATTAVMAGIKQTQIRFKRKDNLPVKIFILEADMNTPKLELLGLAPYNDYIPGLQRLSEMCRDNEAVGGSIVAAINGDTYNTTTGLPTSTFYINNRVYVSTLPAGRTFIAALNDGTIAIGGKDTKGIDRPVNLALIKNAVGGSQWLVDNNVKATLTDVTISARTAFGYTAGKVVYAVIVDGSQAEYSNGLSLADVRDIMAALGVKDAINLDGASSSTLVVKDQARGAWVVQNKPPLAKNIERMIGNGLGFVIKN
ncbi:phosphodiester glycosidase family protein [Pedobacter hiemivivus]|uniref:Phosphodiester glycosidase family protein n=1 Tax=Pedobacter hiemivivus TaxID=2530454 RepID=A0A4U1FY81_9SPHI|nr:phosphodiester glycosidase family protein [Pedobacter hiemivivus]TKC55971.1 phosphodiester glycosidase family protein [Pedobacter hiemivivus]